MLVLVTIAIAAGVSQLAAQGTAARTSQDSLAARLERAEETLAMLQQQLADQAQSAVQSRSKTSFEINGRVLVNAYSNSRRVNTLDAPMTVRPDSATGLPQGGVGMAIRQTTIGFVVTVPDVLGADFTGDLDADFFGGQYDGTTSPIFNLRIARARLRWKNAELMAGYDDPLVSVLNPVSLAAVGLPGFSATGNLWAWLPQIRLGLETSGPVRVGVQGAVVAPSSGSPSSSAENDFAQSSGRPYLESRAHVGWGADDMAAEIGVSTHTGWLSTPNSKTLRDSRGFGADAMLPLAKWLELRGEWYTGDGMRGLGGGAIGQLFDTRGNSIHSTGMWGQVNYKPTLRVTLGAGYGVDDPDDANMAASARLRNAATELHLHLRPAGPLVLGLEYRRMETTYAAGKLSNDHLNLAVGFVF